MAKSQKTGKPNKGWKTAAKRAKQRIEALESILQKVNKRIDQLKGPSAAMKIPALEKALSEKQEADKSLVEEIKLLKHEVSMRPKATAKKAG
jgi:hypothetical protein